MESGAIYSLVTFAVVLLVYAICVNKLMWKVKGQGLSDNETKVLADKIDSKTKSIIDNMKYNANKNRLYEKRPLLNTIWVTYAWYSYEYKGKKRVVKFCDTEKSHMAWYYRLGCCYLSLNEYANSFPETLEVLVNKRSGKYKNTSTSQKTAVFIAVLGFILSLIITVLMAIYVYHYVPEVVYDFV